MPFKHRFTAAGKQKQLQDEAAAWQLLIDALVGTPNHAQVNGLAVRHPVSNAVTGVNNASPNYPRWRFAHRRLSLRARRDRKREQAANAFGPPFHATPGVPHRVDPTLVLRDTVRVAILRTRTSEDHGGGTMLSATNNNKATLPQLHQRLESVLAAIEAELLDEVAHRVDHDLRAAGHAPLQILLASEWYFRIPDRPFTLAERNQILTDLETLSARYPEWLIVPGSIYWSPDPLANATIRVYNQAPVYYGGSQLAIRTKRESHDVDSDLNVRAHQRWGPDYPTVAGVAHPASITAASLGLCNFALRGHNLCVEICRDQAVGDAVKGYLVAAQPGADIFLFTYNGTTPNPHFLPLVHNGIAVYCDGTGPGAHQFLRATRAQPLTHNPLAPAVHPHLQYRNSFEPQRDHDALSSHWFNEARLIENQNAPPFAAFMAKFNNVFEHNSDPVLKAAIDGPLGFDPAVVAPMPPPVAVAPARDYHKKGLRIQAVLAGGSLPTGVAIPLAEVNAATPYAAALNQFGAEDIALRATSATTTARKTAAETAFNVATAALNPGVVAIPGFYDLTLYQLQDL